MTAASLTVTSPDNCALGGDLFALVRQPSGEMRVVNASGPAPREVRIDHVRARYGSAMPIVGPDTVTVPGLLGGWQALYGLGANLPWRDLLEVAIAQASDGVPLVASAADSLQRKAEIFRRDEGMAELLYPDGRPLEVGALLTQPELAASLEQVATEGARTFYEGDLGQRWIGHISERGSALEQSDLADYEPEVTDPLTADWGPFEIATAPPNSQGFLLPLILDAITDGNVPDPLSDEASAIASAFRAAAETRIRLLADPRFAEVPTDALHPPVEYSGGMDRRLRARGDTVAVVAADGEGRAVCLIQSVFHDFGAGILDPGTGIIAHNRGAAFSLDPSSPNVLAGGKRPAHTLTPTLVHEGGELRAVLGTMGGLIQPQTLAHILLHLALGRDGEYAVQAPRWVVGGMEAGSTPREVLVEDGVSAAVTDALERDGWPVLPAAAFGGSVGVAELVTRDASGSYTATSDPRSDGLAWTSGSLA